MYRIPCTRHSLSVCTRYATSDSFFTPNITHTKYYAHETHALGNIQHAGYKANINTNANTTTTTTTKNTEREK